MANKKHGNKHHLIPSSRIPRYLENVSRPWNVKKKTPIKEHRAYHFLFNNRLACEAIEMIKTGRVKRTYRANKRRLNKEYRQKINAKEKAWQTLFNGSSAETAIKIIEEEWTPRHPKVGCFRFKECCKFYNPKKVCPLLKLNRKGDFHE